MPKYTTRTGTKTTFKPDPQIFPQTKFSWDVLARRLQELAFLNSGVRITFTDAVSGQKEEYYYERGVVEFDARRVVALDDDGEEIESYVCGKG